MKKHILSIRHGDEVHLVKVDGGHITVSQLKTLIEDQLQIPVDRQTLSTNRKLLFAKNSSDILAFKDLTDPNLRISLDNLDHRGVVYLGYEGVRTIPRCPAVTPAGSVARQMRMEVSRQDKPHCNSVSFDRDCVKAFQDYVKDPAVKRCGFMYGIVSDDGQVKVHFIYEPPQLSREDNLLLTRDVYEERRVDAIASGLGMKKVGFIFNQTVTQYNQEYTLSNVEVLRSTQFHADSELKEWVTAVVKLKTNEDGRAEFHLEAFQMSDICVRLFREGWFDTDIGPDDDPKLSKMHKEVFVGVEHLKQVVNDFFLVVVKTFYHKGSLDSTFRIENRNTRTTFWDLKTHMDRTKSLPFAKRISDFHLLLFVSQFLNDKLHVSELAGCVRHHTPVPAVYESRITSLGNTS